MTSSMPIFQILLQRTYSPTRRMRTGGWLGSLYRIFQKLFFFSPLGNSFPVICSICVLPDILGADIQTTAWETPNRLQMLFVCEGDHFDLMGGLNRESTT